MTNETEKNNDRSKSNKQSRSSEKTYTGKVDITRSGMAFILVEGLKQDIMVKPHNLNTALDGDQVEVRMLRGSGDYGRKEGRVIAVVKRRNSAFTGVLELRKGAIVIPDQTAIPAIQITGYKNGEAMDGDKVVVNITDWGNGDNGPKGEITTVLDRSNTNDTAMKEILVENGFPLAFPDEVIAESKKLPETVPSDEIAKRKDLRGTFTITIDPVDAKDFDDAISIKKLDNGDYEIGVHIADVSHYVRPGTALDEEAYKRATSVYLTDRVLPMLPEKISNELCSLRPHEDKLTFSVLFHLSPDAEIRTTWIGQTVIHSDHRFAYEEVQEIIEKEAGLHVGDVLVLNHIAKALRKKRIADGAINFSSREVRFKLDENAVPIGVEIKESKEAHQLIEEFMLLANKTVAEAAAKIEVHKQPVPFPFRVHDVPDREKLQLYASFAAKLGYKFDVSSPQGIAQSFNEMLTNVKGLPEQLVLEQLGIRTMSKAVYTTDNIGHYGLGFEQYCHFTSPIRRYPDVMVHRIMAAWLEKNVEADKHMESKCRHCSDMERKAMEAERAANKYKQVEYMRQFIGEVFEGVISGVANFGFWVETLDAKCEGMVSVTSLFEWDDFSYSDSDYALIGEFSHKRFRMGDTVKIRVVSANLEKRQLDYRLVIQDEQGEEIFGERTPGNQGRQSRPGGQSRKGSQNRQGSQNKQGGGQSRQGDRNKQGGQNRMGKPSDRGRQANQHRQGSQGTRNKKSQGH